VKAIIAAWSSASSAAHIRLGRSLPVRAQKPLDKSIHVVDYRVRFSGA